jgi:hypothetical protein
MALNHAEVVDRVYIDREPKISSIKFFMAVTIVFIHEGNSWYLFYTLWQAKQTNPKSKIILLGDQDNKYYQWLLDIDHYSIQSYSSYAKTSLKNYRHLSTNGEDFEKFCIARWFVLCEFLRQHPEIPSCVYLDSDVLVYDSLEKPSKELANFGMTMASYSAHTNFINDLSFLEEFCNFIYRHYEESHLVHWLEMHYQEFVSQVGSGGISDMTFLHKFRSENPDRMGTILNPLKGHNHSVYAFDEGLNSPDGNYEICNGLKNIQWIDKLPHCKHLPSQKLTMFYTLHFQGNSKSKIRYYLASQDPKFFIKKLVNTLIFLGIRFYRKFLSTGQKIEI